MTAKTKSTVIEDKITGITILPPIGIVLSDHVSFIHAHVL